MRPGGAAEAPAMLKGIGLKIGATFAFALMAALIKIGGAGLPGRPRSCSSARSSPWRRWRSGWPGAANVRPRLRTTPAAWPYRPFARRLVRHVRQLHRPGAAAARRRHRLHLRHAADGRAARLDRRSASRSASRAQPRSRPASSGFWSCCRAISARAAGAPARARRDRRAVRGRLGCGRDDPDPTADPIRGDRRDRLLLLLRHRRDQRSCLLVAAAVWPESGAFAESRRGPALCRARRRSSSRAWRRSASWAAAARS